MGTGVPAPYLGAQGQPAQLIPVSDGNFADLASQLKPGQQLRGRVAEILADGKAVVNFRGIFVTAALKGVELARGEVISVMVKHLGNDPTFQIVRPAPAGTPSDRPVRMDRATDAILRELGLPRDEFHGTIVRLMQDYGISPTREAVAAIKDIIARLPFQLDLPAPAGTATEGGAGQTRSPNAVPTAMPTQPGPAHAPGDARAPLPLQRAAGASSIPVVPETASPQSPSPPAPNSAGAAGTESPGQGIEPAAVSGRAVETATFLYAAGLPPHQEMARAAFDYLFAEPRFPAALASFERTAEALQDARLPRGFSEALDGVLAAVRRIAVNPERGQVPEQLRSLVENLGLGHEARLARAAEMDPRPAAPAGPAGPRPEPARAQDLGLEAARDTLKSALLELQAQARGHRADLGAMPAAVREAVETLDRTGGELLRAIHAQQVGNFISQDSTNSMWIQIPLAAGAEVRGGEIQVSWKQDREGRKRDARAPARMTMRLDTRALGPVSVSMRLLGSSLAVVIGVREGAVRDFLAGELSGLVERLAGNAFRVDRCVCEIVEAQDERPSRPVVPTSSLDLRA